MENKINYFKDENNKVFAYDNKAIAQGYGKNLTAITENEMQELTKATITLEQNIVNINAKAGALIENEYPIYKQLNISNLLTPYVEADKATMVLFIENIREISNTAIENGTLLDDINWE